MKMRRKVKFTVCLIVMLALSLLSFTSCGEKIKKNELSVVATLFPQYDLARSIGGDKIEITKLLPWGSESHTYDPSIMDISKTLDADVFLFTGCELERWTESIVEAASNSDCKIVNLSEGIRLIDGIDGHGDDAEKIHNSHSHGGDYDPHIWTSPENAIIMVNKILDTFCELDSDNSEYYRRNAEALIGELTELSSDFRAVSEKYDGRTLYFGGRFAFLYMFTEYGFSYSSPYRGCGEESEPSIRTVTEICESIKRDRAGYIFFEEMSEGKIANGISEETGAQPLLLHSCHNLTYDEAMSGKTYVSVMRDNLENLKLALGM